MRASALPVVSSPLRTQALDAEPPDRSRWVGWLSFSVSLVVVLSVAVAATLNDHAHEEALPPPPLSPAAP